MNFLHSFVSKRGAIQAALAATLMLLFFGCGPDTDAVLVDFSKTTKAETAKPESPSEETLRVAVGAMISPKETFTGYREFLNYIGAEIGRSVDLVQRKTYQEVNSLLKEGRIDLAFVCSGPYAMGKEEYGLEILATPEVRGSHFYQAYLIVNKESGIDSLESLRGRTFAFTDPDSNTGRLVPAYWLYEIDERPETFFRKTVYTYSHDNSILAVSKGLVDGASVDGLIWEYYHRQSPAFTEKTRIIRKSDNYGIPPLVVHKSVSPVFREQIRHVLLTMHLAPEGQRILKELMIDRFIIPNEQWYARIREMSRELASER
ncbi:MAG: phosphate/phosphite/phosphonate ABC transporter substrate-binding protein [Deltaproteobacteria bacterium]|nr:phosphate/phosphite/phosphonate ABC transporter substrate-binding protein [Deltaproteobacteria bacterium]